MSNCLTMTTIAKNIRRIMREHGVRQEDLAEATGLQRSNISRLLTAPDANPTVATLELIASALGVACSDFFENSPEKIAC